MSIIWFISIFAFSLVELGLAGANRILELINSEAELDENLAGHAASVRGDITFENVSFGYDESPILQDLSFTINSGETVAIVGATGAGKSTVINLLSRLYDIKSGEILVDGINIKDATLVSLRKEIAVVLQDVFLFAFLKESETMHG